MENTIQVPAQLWTEMRDTIVRLGNLMTDLHPQREEPKEESLIRAEAWYDNAELCQLLNVAKATAQRWRSEGMIAYQLIGRKVQYQGREILRFIEVYAAPHGIYPRPIKKSFPEGRLINI